jgi:ATP-binding cassette subfamily B protein/subfamily B ATP-binding cassette protein MsbA
LNHRALHAKQAQKRGLKHLLGPFRDPLLNPEPAARLVRSTARQQWRLIALNLLCSLVDSISEGTTLAVIFLAVQTISSIHESSYDWSTNPLVSRLPELAAWLNGLSQITVILALLALAVALQALQGCSRFLSQISLGYFAARCVARITALIHHQILAFSFACASSYKVGDLTDYAATGPQAVRTQIEVLGSILLCLLLIATYLLVLVGISPWLLLAVALMGAAIWQLQHRMLPLIRAGSLRVNRAQVSISTRITEDFQGLRLLHSSGQLDAADRRLQRGMGELETALRQQVGRLSLVGPLSGFLSILVVAMIVGLSLVLFGERSTGVMPSLVTFVVAVQRLNARLSGLAGLFNSLADNSARLARLNQVLSPAGKQFRRLGGTPFLELKREIRFDGVGLRYAPDLPPALEDICFDLPRGGMLALVGPSGAGKSSIADLLVGIYAPTTGRILVDGRSLGQLELASWQQRLGVVSQDTFLFNATVAENVSFGMPAATRAQVEAACAAAQAAGFIEDLPHAYDTLVGERGYRLSGGQRQRLSLARAILRNPELLILDEATSALDSSSERLVQEAIERFERDHTVLVIAHRLSTIVRADQILVLEAGRVVERGRHPDLLALGGLYQQLWRQQTDVTGHGVARPVRR